MGVRGAGVRGAAAGLEMEGEVSERSVALRAAGARRALFSLFVPVPQRRAMEILGGGAKVLIARG